MEFRDEEKDQEVQTTAAGRSGWHVAYVSNGCRSSSGISQVHRMFFVSGRVSRTARASDAQPVYRPAPLRLHRCSRNAPARCGRSPARLEGNERRRTLQHHEVLYQGLSGKHHHYGQCDHPAQGTRGRSLLRSVADALPGIPGRCVMPENNPAAIQMKALSKEGIPAALERAERYRLLNEPSQAESICLDILTTEPHNNEALIMLLLALTDQFEGRADHVGRARNVLSRI